MANYQQLIRDEMKYQRERLYKRLKKSDNGRLIVEYWAGAKDFLSGVPGINWEKQGNKILIKEDTNMKSFKDILKDSEPIQEGTWNLPFTLKQAKALQKVMKNPVPSGEKGTKMLSGLIGDDSLYDDIEGASGAGGKDDVRDMIKNWVADILKDYKDEPDNFGDKLDPKAEKILRKL